MILLILDYCDVKFLVYDRGLINVRLFYFFFIYVYQYIYLG